MVYRGCGPERAFVRDVETVQDPDDSWRLVLPRSAQLSEQ
jgi:hypothetical protein